MAAELEDIRAGEVTIMIDSGSEQKTRNQDGFETKRYRLIPWIKIRARGENEAAYRMPLSYLFTDILFSAQGTGNPEAVELSIPFINIEFIDYKFDTKPDNYGATVVHFYPNV